MRGVWIEIAQERKMQADIRSLPMRGVWIEIVTLPEAQKVSRSLPMRGVWIEMDKEEFIRQFGSHSPCGECGLKSRPIR